MSQTRETLLPPAAEVLFADHPAGRPPDPFEELFDETLTAAVEDEDALDQGAHFTSVQDLDEVMMKLGDGERGELGMYMRAIGQIALLTAEEEVALAIRIEAGVTAQKALEDEQ